MTEELPSKKSVDINLNLKSTEFEQIKNEISELKSQFENQAENSGAGNAPLGEQGNKELGITNNKGYASRKEMFADIYRMKRSKDAEESEFGKKVSRSLWTQSLNALKSGRVASLEFDGNIRELVESQNQELRKGLMR